MRLKWCDIGEWKRKYRWEEVVKEERGGGIGEVGRVRCNGGEVRGDR